MKFTARTPGVLLVLGLAGLAIAAGNAGPRPDNTPNLPLEFAQKYPGVRVESRAGRVSMVWGKPMTKAATPLAAADAFIEQDIAAFNAGAPTLSLERMNDMGLNASTAVVYTQVMDGIPVERSRLRVLTKQINGESVVAMVNAHLAVPPAQGFRPDRLGAQQAVERVSNDPAWAGMQEFSEPELVVYAGEGDEEQPVETVRAWKFWGRGPTINGVPFQRYFFVDASNGNLAFVRDAVFHGSNDVTGTVRGFASPGLLPDDTYNPPALLPIPEGRVQVSGGASAFTNRDGTFTINNAAAGPLSVIASVTSGRWVNVNNDTGTEISTTASGVTPPTPVDITLNPTPGASNSPTTAQVNALIHQTNAHNYFRDRAPSFAGLDNSLPANVNINSACNAFFDPIGLSTNYYVQGESPTQPGVFCVNTAFSSVIAHEYGHYIVNQLGLAQGAFGEGFSDTVAMLTYDDPIVGRGFRLNNANSFVRSPEAANIQYPCSASCGSGVHCCGQIIGGTVWDMRTNFVNAYGPATGLDLIRQLHVDWALITNGGIGSNSAHPQTAIEFLTVDDNDAEITNGTPNFALICNAFNQHGINCPALALVDFDYPSGQPSIASPAGTTTLQVSALPLATNAVPGSGEFFYSINGAPFTSIPMADAGLNAFSVQIPGATCGDGIRYYVRVAVQSGGFATDPINAPTQTYSVVSGLNQVTPINDAEANSGWSLGIAGDTATSGVWEFGDPVGTAAQPENDRTPNPGTLCFFTGQGAPGGSLGANDVDGGRTTLVSPPTNLTGAARADVSYWRWYSNSTGGDPNNDVLTVQISSDGTNWFNLEVVGPSGVETEGGWYFRSFNVADFITLGSAVRVRFIADDAGAGSLIEAAVDDFRIDVTECVAPPACPGDANGDNNVNFVDITTVLANFGTTGPAGDADNSGTVDFADITTVLANFGNICN